MRAQGDGCPPKPSPTADLVPIPKPLPRKAREGKGQAHHHNRDPPIDHPPPQKTQQGPGKGEGQLRLGLQYRAVENIAGEEIESATQGLLLVSIIRAEGLGGDAKAGPLRFVSAKLSKPAREGAGAALRTRLVGDGSVSYDTPPLRGDAPRWMSDNKFTFYDVGLEVRGRGVLIGFGFWGLGRKPGDGRFVFLCFVLVVSRPVACPFVPSANTRPRSPNYGKKPTPNLDQLPTTPHHPQTHVISQTTKTNRTPSPSLSSKRAPSPTTASAPFLCACPRWSGTGSGRAGRKRSRRATTTGGFRWWEGARHPPAPRSRSRSSSCPTGRKKGLVVPFFCFFSSAAFSYSLV